VEKWKIDEGMRNRAFHIPGIEVERGHSLWMAMDAGNTSPVAQRDFNAPIGHGIMRVLGDKLLKFQEGFLIMSEKKSVP